MSVCETWILVTLISMASLISLSASDLLFSSLEKLVPYHQVEVHENLGSQAVKSGFFVDQVHIHSKSVIDPDSKEYVDTSKEDPDHHHDVEHQWSWDQLHMDGVINKGVISDGNIHKNSSNLESKISDKNHKLHCRAPCFCTCEKGGGFSKQGKPQNNGGGGGGSNKPNGGGNKPFGGVNKNPFGGGNPKPNGGGNHSPFRGGNHKPHGGGGNYNPFGGGNHKPHGGGNNNAFGGGGNNAFGGGKNSPNREGNNSPYGGKPHKSPGNNYPKPPFNSKPKNEGNNGKKGPGEKPIEENSPDDSQAETPPPQQPSPPQKPLSEQPSAPPTLPPQKSSPPTPPSEKPSPPPTPPSQAPSIPPDIPEKPPKVPKGGETKPPENEIPSGGPLVLGPESTPTQSGLSPPVGNKLQGMSPLPQNPKGQLGISSLPKSSGDTEGPFPQSPPNAQAGTLQSPVSPTDNNGKSSAPNSIPTYSNGKPTITPPFPTPEGSEGLFPPTSLPGFKPSLPVIPTPPGGNKKPFTNPADLPNQPLAGPPKIGESKEKNEDLKLKPSAPAPFPPHSNEKPATLPPFPDRLGGPHELSPPEISNQAMGMPQHSEGPHKPLAPSPFSPNQNELPPPLLPIPGRPGEADLSVPPSPLNEAPESLQNKPSNRDSFPPQKSGTTPLPLPFPQKPKFLASPSSTPTKIPRLSPPPIEGRPSVRPFQIPSGSVFGNPADYTGVTPPTTLPIGLPTNSKGGEILGPLTTLSNEILSNVLGPINSDTRQKTDIYRKFPGKDTPPGSGKPRNTSFKKSSMVFPDGMTTPFGPGVQPFSVPKVNTSQQSLYLKISHLATIFK
ncbi:hypothetical protein CROQUDRAFT_136204 [Cronartium quercuum f. sp. fusiforme G11]|uniref:Uncharacterized protein n=1 Tax=Cronartium quercuum f. sp. fusiforme G11 TaxID=708437 RepID=A0A9P6T8B7_9BASI|nr:hypothetical protein CROQUDRAFT_136204 [Cronartium quercuum f. sp. fusiforme G11]